MDRKIKSQEVSETASEQQEESTPPMGFRVIVREFRKDKVAMFALGVLTLLLLTTLVWYLRLDADAVMEVDILQHFKEPADFKFSLIADAWNGEKTLLLGTDDFGRDIFTQLFLATGNSVVIAIAVTTIIAIVGITLGLIAGYYGGMVDNVIMRVTDFVMTLPQTMIIIVFLVIVPKQTILSFIFIMSVFAWTGYARIVRSKALSESRLDYISASKTIGTPTWKIILIEMLPNLTSLITVQLILSYAGNIGLETGLTFLGYGLPDQTASLGRLVSAATTPFNLENRPWVWLPASTVILVLMLSINYVGQALKRSTDAKQRLG
ncbi:MAG: ABC transporter permease [Atopostipes sp.]|nr:ABC transporter permease [Atopostipes sp.]